MSRFPSNEGIKEGYPLRNRYFTTIGSSSMKTVADRRRLAAYHSKHCRRAFQWYQHAGLHSGIEDPAVPAHSARCHRALEQQGLLCHYAVLHADQTQTPLAWTSRGCMLQQVVQQAVHHLHMLGCCGFCCRRSICCGFAMQNLA